MRKVIIGIFAILLVILFVLFISSIDTTEAATKTLAQTVIDLSNGTSYTEGNGNGVYYTNSHEYRYVGGEVNNYVSFNDDLYRIIGVFDNYSTGVSGNLVKLIRARQLTALSWGVYNSVASSYVSYAGYKNDWTGNTTGVPASANIILNEFYYNPNAVSSYGECINWTFISSLKTKDCSRIKGYGIQSDDLRNYIEPVTWYLYGYADRLLNKSDWYLCERNHYSGCTSANSGAYQGTANASIGLMYISDYMYASGYVASDNTSIVGSSTVFANSNWLYNGSEWTITPVGNSNNRVFIIDRNSNVYADYTTYVAVDIRPTFYLKSQVYVTGGDGSFHNPYTIACDDCTPNS